MTKITPIYTAHAKATGGRQGGAAATDDGNLSVKLSRPKELGGTDKETGTNPEQLFAAGYAACFISSIQFVGGRDKISVPADVSIESSVGIGQIPGGFGLAVELKISLPGLAADKANYLIEEAHKVCPYSNATRGNIEVKLVLV